MLLRFWGTRGSIATPGPSTLRYGGNTSCVEAVTLSGQRFIFDCGTGVRALGIDLMTRSRLPVDATLLLSHTHWDHIQGFPFFAPLFVPGNRITVCGPSGANSSLPEVLAGQMEYTYFPVELEALGAQLQYRDLTEGTHDFGDVKITAQLLNHPANALGYRIEADGVSVLYLCDHEPFRESLWRSDAVPGRLESILHEGDRRHAAFMQNADLVIHDSQYTPEEYPSKKNWGHSTYSYVTRIAAAANVKRLFLTHHDPAHSDDFLDRVEAAARLIAAEAGSAISIDCAREGYEISFEHDRDNQTQVNEVPEPELPPDASLLILVVDDDPDLRELVRMALRHTGHRVMEAANADEALASIHSHRPDVMILDLFMPVKSGFEVLRALREREEFRLLPVIVLTAYGDEVSARESFELGALDFLEKPFTPPQLEARVRSCFAHARH